MKTAFSVSIGKQKIAPIGGAGCIVSCFVCRIFCLCTWAFSCWHKFFARLFALLVFSLVGNCFSIFFKKGSFGVDSFHKTRQKYIRMWGI